MKTPPTTIREVITALRKIPAKDWCVDSLENEKGQCCVMGQIGKLYYGNPNCYNSYPLVFKLLDMPVHNLTDVNNGAHGNPKRLRGIKTRVLRFLKSLDILKHHLPNPICLT